MLCGASSSLPSPLRMSGRLSSSLFSSLLPLPKTLMEDVARSWILIGSRFVVKKIPEAKGTIKQRTAEIGKWNEGLALGGSGAIGGDIMGRDQWTSVGQGHLQRISSFPSW